MTSKEGLSAERVNAPLNKNGRDDHFLWWMTIIYEAWDRSALYSYYFEGEFLWFLKHTVQYNLTHIMQISLL